MNFQVVIPLGTKMNQYDKIAEECGATSSLTTRLVDKFLIYYAAARNNLEQVMQSDFARYRHATTMLPPDWEPRARAQYLAHRVFMQEGLIRRFLKHPELKKLSGEELEFLEFHADHPWRFSLGRI